jgi:hypothetical protein
VNPNQMQQLHQGSMHGPQGSYGQNGGPPYQGQGSPVQASPWAPPPGSSHPQWHGRNGSIGHSPLTPVSHSTPVNVSAYAPPMDDIDAMIEAATRSAEEKVKAQAAAAAAISTTAPSGTEHGENEEPVEKKAKKEKDKDKDKATRLIYTDNEASPEEKKARLSRYATISGNVDMPDGHDVEASI